jgi:hypothetical protein
LSRGDVALATEDGADVAAFVRRRYENLRRHHPLRLRPPLQSRNEERRPRHQNLRRLAERREERIGSSPRITFRYHPTYQRLRRHASRAACRGGPASITHQ